MKHSAGILISTVIDGVTKYLLCHPTSAGWKGTYSIPKGEHDPSKELSRDAAIRETEEETSVLVLPDEITNPLNGIFIGYRSKVTKKLYKDVIVYKASFNYELNKHLLNSNYSVKKKYLQLKEVDWAGFLAPWELYDKVFWRFKFLVMNINHLFGKVLVESIPIEIEKGGKGFVASTKGLITQYGCSFTPELAYKDLQVNIEELYNDLKETDDKELSEEFIQKKKYLNNIIKGL